MHYESPAIGSVILLLALVNANPHAQILGLTGLRSEPPSPSTSK